MKRTRSIINELCHADKYSNKEEIKQRFETAMHTYRVRSRSARELYDAYVKSHLCGVRVVGGEKYIYINDVDGDKYICLDSSILIGNPGFERLMMSVSTE